MTMQSSTSIDTILATRESQLLAELGAITAYRVVTSKASTATIRQCSKLLDSTSVQLRRELIELDKTLVISND